MCSYGDSSKSVWWTAPKSSEAGDVSTLEPEKPRLGRYIPNAPVSSARSNGTGGREQERTAIERESRESQQTRSTRSQPSCDNQQPASAILNLASTATASPDLQDDPSTSKGSKGLGTTLEPPAGTSGNGSDCDNGAKRSTSQSQSQSQASLPVDMQQSTMDSQQISKPSVRRLLLPCRSMYASKTGDFSPFYPPPFTSTRSLSHLLLTSSPICPLSF